MVNNSQALSALILLFQLLLPFHSHGKIVKSEGEAVRPRKYSYVIFQDDRDFRNTDVIYFFHGQGSGLEQTETVAKALYQAYREQDTPVPRIIGLTFGPSWLLASKNSSRLSGLMEATLENIIPSLERRLLLGPKVANRHLLGMSMGGLNAWEAATENPWMFSKVALIAPALFPISPYATHQEITDFATNELNLDVFSALAAESAMRNLATRFKDVLPTRRDWNRFDPALRMTNRCGRHLGGEPALKTMIVIGKKDLLFYKGTLNLKMAAQEAGWPIKLLVHNGGHTYSPADLSNLAKFLK